MSIFPRKRPFDCYVAALALAGMIFLATPINARCEDNNQAYLAGMAAAQRGDYAVAIEILLPLAEEGDTAAQTTLAQVYFIKRGHNDDVRAAEKWFRVAAEKGVAAAQFGLGSILWNRYVTNSIAEDHAALSEAEKWYRLAAEQEFAPAQMALGQVLMWNKKREEGFQWYLRAANQGHVKAYSAVSSLYESGRGVEKDLAEAVRWARLAAEEGDTGGYWRLARMYEKGVGVSQDVVQAYMWFQLIFVADNDKSAAIYRDIVASRMTPEQIAEAQRRADEWAASHRP